MGKGGKNMGRKTFAALMSAILMLFVLSLSFPLRAYAEGAEYLSCPDSFCSDGVSQRYLTAGEIRRMAETGGPSENSSPTAGCGEALALLGGAFRTGSADVSSGSFEFIRSAAERENALYAGTFLDSSDPALQFEYLTGKNRFPVSRFDAENPFPSYDGNIFTGDIIFVYGPSGEIANAVFVCEKHSEWMLLATEGESGTVTLTKADDAVLSELSAGCGFTVVHPNYAYNEQLIYLFCVNEMKLTGTGACGVLANVRLESSSMAEREEELTGDGFGICQWSGERRTDLERFCEENGLDRSLLESQLRFLQSELENDFSFTGDFLRSAPNDETGAYDSGYWFCFEYEQPLNFELLSDERATLALEIWKDLANA